MPALAKSAAASSAEPASSPGMKRLTARLANLRLRNCSANHLLREARSRTLRAMDMPDESYSECGRPARADRT